MVLLTSLCIILQWFYLKPVIVVVMFCHFVVFYVIIYAAKSLKCSSFECKSFSEHRLL